MCGLVVCPSRTSDGVGPVRNQVLYHRVRLFSLVPLVWKSTPKLQGGWCKSKPPAHPGYVTTHYRLRLCVCVCLLLQYLLESCSCVFAWGEGVMCHESLVTTTRGLCGLVCPSRTSERGGEGDCGKEGGGGEGEREREGALGLPLSHSHRH